MKPDIGTEQQACLMVRIFDKDTNQVCSFFYKLVTVGCADSEGLFETVYSTFSEDEISFDKLSGFGSDGAI